MNKTLAIIGSHPRTREQFDFSRSDVDVWLFNEAVSNKLNTWAKRADAVFQMHIPAIWKNPNNRNDPKHYEWLQSQTDCTVYMQEQYTEVPKAVKYPLDEILIMIGGTKEDHFLTSSVPQAMALAAYLKQYDHVEIYGVAMETNTEYQFQREGVAHWYGFLRGMGVDVYFADPTFHAPMYGYEGEVFIKYERFAERIAELKPKHDERESAYTAATQDLYKAIDAFLVDSGAENEKKLAEAVTAARVACEQLGTLDGAIQENERYQKKAESMMGASGEFVFSRQEFESGAKTYQDNASKATGELISMGTTLEHLHGNLLRCAKGSPKHKKYKEMYLQAIQRFMQLQNYAGILRGVSGENFNYMTYLDKHIRAAGGEKSEQAILETVQHA